MSFWVYKFMSLWVYEFMSLWVYEFMSLWKLYSLWKLNVHIHADMHLLSNPSETDIEFACN